MIGGYQILHTPSAPFDTLCVPSPELVEGSGRTEEDEGKRSEESDAKRTNVGALHSSRGRGTGLGLS
ncbi:MAG: hypothetical protein B7Y54_11995 [Polaromonas sp. 35-63-240]|nr:MAG: hypothetical protein B7Y54_11995 [Polaromonas sp. 35-63-240]